jgi:hypothetical protein
MGIGNRLRAAYTQLRSPEPVRSNGNGKATSTAAQPVAAIPAPISVPSGSRLLVQSWEDIWVPVDGLHAAVPGHRSVLIGVQGVVHKQLQMKAWSTYTYCVSDQAGRDEVDKAICSLLQNFDLTAEEQAQLENLRREIARLPDVVPPTRLLSQSSLALA